MASKEIPSYATIRLLFVRCGNETCRCAAGGADRHGPYFYAQWRDRETGKRRSVYVGKNVPFDVEQRVRRVVS